MNARKENYEYFAHYYALRNKVTQKVRQDLLNPTESTDDQAMLNPMFRANGSSEPHRVNGRPSNVKPHVPS